MSKEYLGREGDFPILVDGLNGPMGSRLVMPDIKDANKMEPLLAADTAIKYDKDKLDWSLVPWDSVEEILKVLEFGKTKYSAWNWSTGEGFTYTRVFNSSMRHLLAWIRGQDNDPETGLSHIAHLGCNVLFLMYYIKHKDKYINNDDRPNVR